MKKIQRILALILIISMTGCGGKNPSVETNEAQAQTIESEAAAQEEVSQKEQKSEPEEVTEPSLDLTAEHDPDARPELPPDTSLLPEVRSVTISFAGDCTLGTYKGQYGDTTFDKIYDQMGPAHFLSNVKDIFSSDDLTFVNLEGPLTDYPQTAEKEYPIRGEKEYVQILTEGSVEVANLANNHIYDCGNDGFHETIQVLTDHGIGTAGEGQIYITEVNDVKVGMLGYRIFSVSEELRGKMKEDIENLRAEGAELVCVMTHGGTPERVYESNEDQEEISHYLIDCGADVVVGGHPHVIQGIEIYNGKYICYSLSNFSFGANKNPPDKDTFIYQQEFLISREGQVSYGDNQIIPCKISAYDDWNDYRPTSQDPESSEGVRILDKIRSSSEKYPVGWE